MCNKITTENESKELKPKIEKITKANIENVMQIESKSFDFPWKKKKSFMQYTEQGDAFVVQIERNIIVGYVLIKRKNDTIVLYKMAVDPKYRSKGLGKFIVKWIQEFANGRSAKRLLLHVRASNCQAIRLYRNTGFEEIKKIENYYKRTGLRPEEKAAVKMQWICSK